MNQNLKGKTALVCGASRGIGAAAAQELSELGCRVILMARNAEKLEEVKSQLAPVEHGHQICSVDFSDRKDLKIKVDGLLKEVGAIQILVCNTGGPKSGPLIEADEEAFLEAFQNHVLVNHLLVKALVPGMKASGYGRIINVISTSVKIPIPNLGVSNTIRGAVASWSKTLANELGSMGITVNNILPGFTATERLENLKKATGDRLGKTTSEVEEMWKKTIPLGRFAKPQETGAAVAFLASPAASYISGINVPVDGGRTGSL